ncbi:FAD-dependent oxidoreductase, partial [Mesorhizobium sp. M5C.F.Ca.ET.164.01.1.1]|uniref:FAD-dependent oxidoreductase n=1 Tax=Mesorhizobium sp. M5C.F.Ca.ET.164.01.1.1 TaxID=2563957 RepID=UPI001FEE044F
MVIGGGSTGCVIASRLSENPDASVFLLEEGPRGNHAASRTAANDDVVTFGLHHFFLRTYAPKSLAMRCHRSYPKKRPRFQGQGAAVNVRFTAANPDNAEASAASRQKSGIA